jgi:hypothetical protein
MIIGARITPEGIITKYTNMSKETRGHLIPTFVLDLSFAIWDLFVIWNL